MLCSRCLDAVLLQSLQPLLTPLQELERERLEAQPHVELLRLMVEEQDLQRDELVERLRQGQDPPHHSSLQEQVCLC